MVGLKGSATGGRRGPDKYWLNEPLLPVEPDKKPAENNADTVGGVDTTSPFAVISEDIKSLLQTLEAIEEAMFKPDLDRVLGEINELMQRFSEWQQGTTCAKEAEEAEEKLHNIWEEGKTAMEKNKDISEQIEIAVEVKRKIEAVLSQYPMHLTDYA